MSFKAVQIKYLNYFQKKIIFNVLTIAFEKSKRNTNFKKFGIQKKKDICLARSDNVFKKVQLE